MPRLVGIHVVNRISRLVETIASLGVPQRLSLSARTNSAVPAAMLIRGE